MASEWTPFPSFLDSLVVPKLSGKFSYYAARQGTIPASSYIVASVSHEPLDTFDVLYASEARNPCRTQSHTRPLDCVGC